MIGRFGAVRSASAFLRIRRLYFERVIRHLIRFCVGHPRVFKLEIFRVHAPDPGGVAPGDVEHLINDCRALGCILHVLHALEQAVERRVVVVRGILAVMPHLLVRPIEQEQKIYRVRGNPRSSPSRKSARRLCASSPENGCSRWRGPLARYPVFQLLEHPVELGLSFRANGRRFIVDRQRFPRRGIHAVWITRLRQQPACGFDRLAFGLAIHPVIHIRIDAGAPHGNRKYPAPAAPAPRFRGHSRIWKSAPRNQWRWK